MGSPAECCFLAVNDLHFMGEDNGAWLRNLVARMNAHPEQPEFCLLLGDLVEDGTEAQLRTVRRALDGLSMPWHAVPGNHDGDAATWKAVFPESRNYAFERGGWRFIGLDTTAGTAYENTLIPRDTLDWLATELAASDPEESIVLFTHFPLGEGIHYRPRNADALLEVAPTPRLRAVLSGHFHAATEVYRNDAVLVTSRCCSPGRANHDGSALKGYQLCRLRGKRLERTFVPVEFSA